ncbi:hypothetical protein INR49_023433 [Caranx melampygus]|nr:hypothetical protein INR49_023433 [Caranx melampygus]
MAPPLSLNTTTPVQLHDDGSCAAAAASERTPAPSASRTGFLRQRVSSPALLCSARLGSALSCTRSWRVIGVRGGFNHVTKLLPRSTLERSACCPLLHSGPLWVVELSWVDCTKKLTLTTCHPQLNTMPAAPTMAFFFFFFFLQIFTAIALESTSEQVLPQRHPHLTGCVSNNMETFRCRWNVSSFQNLSEPGDLRLFYITKTPTQAFSSEWRECPHYSTDQPHECFFNESHTSIWIYYSVQLRSRDQATLYDEDYFFVQDIVQPDPPLNLNWTLNVSMTGTHYDIMLSWKPLMSRFPVVALLIFGALCLLAILMLVVISQQQKLMVILLPPVPGPKIKGIDPELLKKGKLRELTSILGSPPDLRPELYNSDPWVEFIELDMEEQSDRPTDLDTDCLMERSLSSNCSPLSIGFRDDDSGRASCCDPDLPIDPELSPFHPLIPHQSLSTEPSCPAASEPNSPVEIPAADEPPSGAPGRETLYTQVSEVKSSGMVLLSPEEQTEVEKATEKDMEEKEKEKKEFQLFMMNVDLGGYTSELSAGKIIPRLCTGDLSEPCQAGGSLTSSPPPSPCYKSDTTTVSPLAPAPVYTMVEGVDRQNTLLLTPNSTPAPQLIIPKPVPTPDGYLTPELLGSVTP